ncbi:NAD(P)H-hydrate dehydratase [Variovorax sp. VNK109]|uniref:NAD(P)H-hydrate dehydratase n=1 Tax=Variovorax sp. VNK109 TaxID=3400919 RepID=UPI003C04FFCA
MQRIHTGHGHSLHDIASTRRIEHAAAGALPDHALMQRAGLAVAKLAMALQPHARHVWIACGPGNNGGDGLEAAVHLHRAGFPLTVTYLGNPDDAPQDAHAAWQRAGHTGVRISREPPRRADLVIDALLGIGATRAPQGLMATWIDHMSRHANRVLAIDVPSGLNADTGMPLGAGLGAVVHAHDTLSLLTLKPGLFTGQGRDLAGTVWCDALDVTTDSALPVAMLNAHEMEDARPHASHKGSYGDVTVVGGAPGMAGAALLAARAALHSGAGRVFAALLDTSASVDAGQPELMMRAASSLDYTQCAVVCGCGGGDVIRLELPRVLSNARQLVLDADALNSIAADAQLQHLLVARSRRAGLRPTVMTPHPLEAARLLECSTADVQANRLQAAQTLAGRFGVVVVLKGSGTVIAAPGELPRIHHGGNARLATAGTGDVLAGMIGARLARGETAVRAACQAVARHAQLADSWPAQEVLTASRLAQLAGSGNFR